ncbi:zinc finger CCCH domain-containing protein 7-like isoform X1 [Vanessa cardui]|uniref:zinc finger CCCH domain-containing protein 7-like isoform X1 n=1 Tax=Vanessa cardui TaxID=171605 RepID=UPI001F138A0F|nr:zinc finger CCCH domain-containing protein 7-like isoform X1 [Vanessa cardui]
MDRNPNKVYINPNFQRTPLTSWPFQDPDNSNLYKYSSQLQNDDAVNRFGMEQISNRKIYVNPNFKQIKQEQQITKVLERHEKVENVNNYPVLISKSKYSLVSNLNKNKADESYNYTEGIPRNHSINTKHKTNILQNQNSCIDKVLNKTYTNGVPVIKSRYTIVRKNKEPSENHIEVMQQNCKQDLNPSLVVTDKNLSLEICHSYANNVAPPMQENVLKNKPFENVTKIKISKYKTVPATYLKNNISSSKDFNSSSTSQSYNGKYSFNINTYKLTRSESKSNNEADHLKTNVKTSKKSPWPSQSKIKLLKANFKVNNIPCRLFIKYGKCLRKDYGNCEYVHDKKHVSLCRKFLKGICHDSNCTLSHELTANKMPTCYFYLKGICTKENCPYLHIKLNEKIKVCHAFLRGYCENGDTCQFRHVKVNQCKKSKIFNLSTCNKYKTLTNKSTKLKTSKIKCSIKKKDLTQLNNKKNVKSCDTKEADIDCRYYKEIVTNEDSCKNIKPTRCKIGTLPSFIQL